MSLMEKLRQFQTRNRRQQRDACLDIHEWVKLETGEAACPSFDWFYRNVSDGIRICDEDISPARFAAMNRQIINNGADCLEKGIRE